MKSLSESVEKEKLIVVVGRWDDAVKNGLLPTFHFDRVFREIRYG